VIFMPIKTSKPSVLPAEIRSVLSRGWRLFPIVAGSKRPLIQRWQIIASSDLSQAKEWAARYPDCNWATLTGLPSGIVVIDSDGEDGRGSVKLLKAGGHRFPETLKVKTGRGDGGLHRYFKIPEGITVCNDSTGRLLGPGLHVKGTNGYVVVPPSRHETGHRYSYLDANTHIAAMPGWMIERLNRHRTKVQDLDPLAIIPRGARTKHLVSLAGTMNKRGMTQSGIVHALVAENSERCEPPLAETKVRSIAADVISRYSTETRVKHAAVHSVNLVSLAEAFDRPTSKTAWLCEKRLPAGTFSMLVAKPKAGKSTLARNLAVAVAQGEPFLGWGVKQGKVIYCCFEEVLNRVAADLKKMGATRSDQIQLVEAAAMEGMLQTIKEEKPVLVVLDPLVRLLGPVDEKAYGAMYTVLGNLIDVARETDTHILGLHHAPKGVRADAIDSPLGSTALGAAVSTLLVMRKTPSNSRTLETVQRMGPSLPEVVLGFDPSTKTLTRLGSRADADVKNVADQILAVVSSTPLTEPLINDLVHGRNSAKRQALRDLVKQGKLRKTEAGVRANPHLYTKA
jgi:hypothetical protein